MDLPQPPAEQELKNIIDKLAQFVARNGPEFEHMTKQKQKDNPKFSFLFGGTYFHYYQYRVTSEQAILKQKQRTLEQQALVQQAINRQSIQTAPWQQHLQQIQDSSQEQIRQSETNLTAQIHLLQQQQQVQVEEIIRKAQEEKIVKLAKDNDLDLKELNGILQPIIDSCTKDSISTGKGWIFSHATSSSRSEVIVLYILQKVTEPGASFEAKLHLVYLINDVLHHCFRKNAEDLKKILEQSVVPIFCSTSIGVDADKQQKLSKLYKLWETNKYFSQQILDQLMSPQTSLAAYQASLISEYGTVIAPITTAFQTQCALLQKQHQDFVAHLTGQMQQMQIPVPYALQTPAAPLLAAQQAYMNVSPAHTAYDQQAVLPTQTAEPTAATSQVLAEDSPKAPQEMDSSHLADVPLPEEKNLPERRMEPEHKPRTHSRFSDIRDTDMMSPDLHHEDRMGRRGDYPPDDMMDYDMPMHHPNGRGPRYMDDYSPHYGRGPPPYGDMPEYGMTPPHGSYGPHGYRDMPMGMGHHDMPPDYMEPGLPPCVPPYYDLPAGLMVPLVRLEDTDYDKPLDPDDVQLPPPALPTERLLAAVDQFYCPPTHERSYVISSEGWEQLGLYEFFKAKAQAKKERGLTINDNKDYGTSMDLPSMQRFSEPEPSPPRRRYREVKSPEKDKEAEIKNGDRDKEQRRRSSSRSRSRSPDVPPHRSSRSPSPRRSSFQRSRNRSRSPKRGRSPDRRSMSPPSFMGGGGTSSHERRLDESNKGHQLLKKMGWSGAGLGSNEQGIQDPVDAGDVRDRQDMYKGIGVSLNDPYENFRKSKGQAFINRMKARAEELGKS